jgi:hypothetical protein
MTATWRGAAARYELSYQGIVKGVPDAHLCCGCGLSSSFTSAPPVSRGYSPVKSSGNEEEEREAFFKWATTG